MGCLRKNSLYRIGVFITTFLVIVSFLYQGIVWAGDAEVYKLAKQSEVSPLTEKYLPLVESVVRKVANGELSERDFPDELMFLWEIGSRKEAGEAEVHLTPEEIAILDEYIRKTNVRLFARFLRRLLHGKFLEHRIGVLGKGTCLARRGEVGLHRVDEKQEGRVRAAIGEIRNSISRAVSSGRLTDTERSLAGEVVGLLEECFARGDIVAFDALVEAEDDYLLAFPRDGKIALARDFLDPDYVIDFYHTVPDMLFREGLAVRFGEDCEERRSIYSEMRKKIFGEGDLLADDLVFYIDLKLPGEYEIEFDQATLNDKKININRIEELLRDKQFVFRTLERLYHEYTFLFRHIDIGKLEVRHGGTGSQKQTLHVSFNDETTGFKCDFALKTAIDHAAQVGFASAQRGEIPTLKKLSGKSKTPRFGVYVEDPANKFYAYSEEWIAGPTAEEVFMEGKLTTEKVSNVVNAYLSVMHELNTKNPWVRHTKYLGVSDVHARNVMFESIDSDRAVDVDIGKIVYMTPLYALQEFDRYYGRIEGWAEEWRRQCHMAIFDGVIKTFGLQRGIAFLEIALDRTEECERDGRKYKRHETERLGESLKEYLRDLHIKQFAGELSSLLQGLSFHVLRELAHHRDTGSVIEEIKSLIFEKSYNDARDTYENDMSLSNELRLEVIQLIIKSLSTEDINLEDLLNRPPSLDFIEKLLDISFLLSIVAGENIHYEQLPDGTTIIDLEAGRPKLKKEIRVDNTHPARSVLDPLELTGEDVYLSLGGGPGVYNTAALLNGVGRSVWLDISPDNVPFIWRLKKYYSFIRDNPELRDKIENKAILSIIDFIGRIMNMHGMEIPERDPKTPVDEFVENPNRFFGEESLPEIDEDQPSNLDIIVGDAANIPLEDNSVSKMSILELFHWVEKQGGKGKVVQVIREVLRVTKPGGLILFKQDFVSDEKYYINLFSRIAAVMGITLRLKEITPMGGLLFEVVSKSEDIYSGLIGVINRELGLDLSAEELRSIMDPAADEDLLNAFRGDDGRIDAMDLKMAEGIAEVIDSFNLLEEPKMRLIGGLIILTRQYKEKRLSAAKERIARQIALHDTLKRRMVGEQEEIKNVFIDKEALPENQQFILKGVEWIRREQLLKKLFPGYNFIVFSGSIGITETDINKDNSVALVAEPHRERYRELDARLAFIQNAGTEELFPLDALVYLGIGLLNISEADRDGSPLASTISRLYREITNEDIDVRTFLDNYRLDIIIPPIERFSIEELIELHSYAIASLEQAA